MRTRKIVVLPYDPQWKAAFAAIRAELEDALGDLCLTVEHVGSTAVEGLCAKPIIDLDLVIRDMSLFPAVTARLAEIGYMHEGDLGIPEREAFCYSGKEHLMRHHLYVCPQTSRELHRHLVFRDFLRANPEAVRAYGAVKVEAAMLYPQDIDRYIAHKSPCIRALYAQCGLE